MQPLFLKESNSNKEQLLLCVSAALGKAVLSPFSVFIDMHVELRVKLHDTLVRKPAVKRDMTDSQWKCQLPLSHW